MRQLDLDGAPTLDVYLPYSQLHPDALGFATETMFWVVRGRASAEELRGALRQGDAAVPIAELRPAAEGVAGTVAPRRFNLLVLAVFAVAALLLSATGIHAMLSFSVSQRARELAIRAVLGARRRHLLALVVRQGLGPVLIGTAVGLAAAFAAGRLLSSLFFGLGPSDPATFAAVTAGLLLVALAACLGPGLRAARTAARLPAP